MLLFPYGDHLQMLCLVWWTTTFLVLESFGDFFCGILGNDNDDLLAVCSHRDDVGGGGDGADVIDDDDAGVDDSAVAIICG